ncbi:MAG: hypothetical protein K9G70_11825 [Prolixibacteraceae bacterium]|nr:hypothetical protein [Prolixibacteraceae bacterium]
MLRCTFLTLFGLLFYLLPTHLPAQNFEFGLQYDGIGDNREYFSEYNTPETILGSRLNVNFGTRIDSVHRFRAGLSYFYEYGADLLELKPQPILYYAFDGNRWGFKMGAFMRKGNVDYPHAIVSERYEYYNPTVDGLLISYNTGKTTMNVFADWVTRQDSVRHEQFMAGFTGRLNLGNFFFEEYWYMFHDAGRMGFYEGEYIKDYTGALFMAGYDLSSFTPLSIFTVKTGVLSSAFRDRENGSSFELKYSSYSEVFIDYKGFGVEAFLKYGSMHNFSHGDNFYNTTENYSRVRFYVTPFDFDRVKGRFSWSFHFANDVLDQQQQFSLIYTFSEL